MANSSIISKMKDNVIKEIVNDELIVKAIDGDDIAEKEDLINTHIFRYNKNPEFIGKAMTFLTVQVNTESRYSNNGIWCEPTLIIFIYTHNDHMRVTNIPLVHDNRNDYISMLLDSKFNNRNDLGGYGQLKLTSNIEGNFGENFLYRRMIFETRDLSNSLCR